MSRARCHESDTSDSDEDVDNLRDDSLRAWFDTVDSSISYPEAAEVSTLLEKHGVVSMSDLIMLTDNDMKEMGLSIGVKARLKRDIAWITPRQKWMKELRDEARATSLHARRTVRRARSRSPTRNPAEHSITESRRGFRFVARNPGDGVPK